MSKGEQNEIKKISNQVKTKSVQVCKSTDFEAWLTGKLKISGNREEL